MKKRKALIISLYGNFNYGNKLQNYAMQEILLKEGLEVETLNTDIQIIQRRLKDQVALVGYKHAALVMIKNIIRKIGIISLLKKVLGRPDYSEMSDTTKQRIENIKKFDKLIIKSEILPFQKNYTKLIDRYDLFIMGSDQVWNPDFIETYRINLATFVPKERKISYAASVGINKLKGNSKKTYSKALKDMEENNISVREFQAEKIIKELTGQNVQTVLDPTMLLSVDEWKLVMEEPKVKPKGKFLLTYILGDNSKDRRKFIDDVANKYGLEVINLYDDNSPEESVVGVGEFLWYFYNSDFIFADSFHAGVFSILFEKPFYILQRKGTVIDMSSRFETLLTTFDLKNNYISRYDIKNINKNIDYNKINKILEKKKKESLEFLKNALNTNIYMKGNKNGSKLKYKEK